MNYVYTFKFYFSLICCCKSNIVSCLNFILIESSALRNVELKASRISYECVFENIEEFPQYFEANNKHFLTTLDKFFALIEPVFYVFFYMLDFIVIPFELNVFKDCMLLCF